MVYFYNHAEIKSDFVNGLIVRYNVAVLDRPLKKEYFRERNHGYVGLGKVKRLVFIAEKVGDKYQPEIGGIFGIPCVVIDDLFFYIHGIPVFCLNVFLKFLNGEIHGGNRLGGNAVLERDAHRRFLLKKHRTLCYNGREEEKRLPPL